MPRHEQWAHELSEAKARQSESEHLPQGSIKGDRAALVSDKGTGAFLFYKHQTRFSITGRFRHATGNSWRTPTGQEVKRSRGHNRAFAGKPDMECAPSVRTAFSPDTALV
jgi:hypothetical protein